MDTPNSEKNYELAIPTTGNERHDQMTLSASMPATTGSTTTNITSDKGMVFKDITGTVNVNVSHNNGVKQSAAEELNLVANALKKAYSEMSASLTLPWLRSEPFDMEQCFSQLETLVKVTDSSGNDIQAQPTSTRLDCIFDRVQGLKPTRIFLEDPESILSSMVLLQLCRSWSSDCGPAVIYDLVLLLDGRHLLVNTLEEVIIKTCCAKGVDDDSLLKIIKEQPKVLLIFDQLPRELPWGQKTALDQMLKGANYEAVTVLVAYPTTDRYADSEDSAAPKYVICGCRESCTKFLQLHRLSLIMVNVLSATDQVQLLRDIEKELQKYPSLDRDKPVFLLLLIYVFLKVKLPLKWVFSILCFTGMASHNPIHEEIYKSIFKRLVVDQFAPNYPVLYDNINGKNIPPEALLLSSIGEYALNLLTNGASHFTLEQMKNHFQDQLTSVLKIGFVLVKLHYSRTVHVEKLQMVHHSLLEFLIAYHMYVVYRKQSWEHFLLKVDVLNKFQPLHDTNSAFLCNCFANFISQDEESAYVALHKDRPHYSTFLNSLTRGRLRTNLYKF